MGRYIIRDNLLAHTLKQDVIDKFLPQQVTKKLGRIFRDTTFSLKPFFCVKKLPRKTDNPDTSINIVKEYTDFFTFLEVNSNDEVKKRYIRIGRSRFVQFSTGTLVFDYF